MIHAYAIEPDRIIYAEAQRFHARNVEPDRYRTMFIIGEAPHISEWGQWRRRFRCAADPPMVVRAMNE